MAHGTIHGFVSRARAPSSAREVALARAPELMPPPATPEQYRPLLGAYRGGDIFAVLEWRDGKLTFLSPDLGQLRLLATGDEDSFVVGPGYRQSGQ